MWTGGLTEHQPSHSAATSKTPVRMKLELRLLDLNYTGKAHILYFRLPLIDALVFFLNVT